MTKEKKLKKQQFEKLIKELKTLKCLETVKKAERYRIETKGGGAAIAKKVADEIFLEETKKIKELIEQVVISGKLRDTDLGEELKGYIKLKRKEVVQITNGLGEGPIVLEVEGFYQELEIHNDYFYYFYEGYDELNIVNLEKKKDCKEYREKLRIVANGNNGVKKQASEIITKHKQAIKDLFEVGVENYLESLKGDFERLSRGF